MKKTMLKFLMLFTVIALMSSCYPGDVATDDLDTVTTLQTSDFSKPDKVVIWWGVHQIKSEDGDGDIPYRGEIDEEILNTTLDNLVDLYGVDNVYIFNYDNSPDPAPSKPVRVITPNDVKPNVDLKIIPAIILKENISIGYYPPYWDPWYPWYPCWYCWYPPVYDISSYEVGTVLVGMVNNPWSISKDDKGEWLAAVRGLISSSNSFNGSRTVTGINKAFDQSPYLK
jgi:hypothetical protein